MKKAEILVGGRYEAKVNNRITVVVVTAIRLRLERQVYDVTNTATGRQTTFYSAAKFRRAV